MDYNLLKLTDVSFPISIIEHCKTQQGSIFEAHIHEHYLQFFYFTQGRANIYYNQESCEVNTTDILLINNNELHYGENISEELRFFVFRIDLNLLSSYHINPFGTQYLEPLMKNLVIFNNHIKSRHISKILNKTIKEYKEKRKGYELKIVAYIFDLLGELFRKHIKKSYSQRDAEVLMKKTRRFAEVFDYIENNYANVITLSEISKKAHMSEGYFCRMFKQSTGKTLIEYINRLRTEKAVILLNEGSCNVTEAALSVGFDDINYFCRVFKKYMKQSPANYLKNDRRFFL